MIIRNLIENTLRHTDSKEVEISILPMKNEISLNYNDHGSRFDGDLSQLGNLFYKYNSPKGSGLGLYLIRRLTQKMGGEFKINNEKSLSFSLTFKRGEND